MRTIDFSRSTLTFRIDLEKKPPLTVSHKPPFTVNNARIPIDCHCEITDRQSGTVYSFDMGVNCKTERVGVDRDIWTQPNADFVPIFSQDEFLNIKTWEHVGKQVMLYPASMGQQPERQRGRRADAFDSVRIDLSYCQARPLESPDQIIDAVLSNQIMVARTTIQNERYQAQIDYPVKTINASERDLIYQTDTGPILLPDLTREPADLLAGMELAFSAFNCPDWIEFIVRVPTPVSDSISVYHYSMPVRWDAQNQLFALP